MILRQRSTSAPAFFGGTTAKAQPLVSSSVPTIHHKLTGRKVGVPGHDAVDESWPYIRFDETGGVQSVCLRCLKWSLSTPSNTRTPFTHETKVNRLLKDRDWGLPFEMRKSRCALCRLFALHTFDYFRNPMEYRVFDLNEIACQTNHASMESSDYFTSKASFWCLDPGNRPRANAATIIGPGACIGKMSHLASGIPETLTPVQVNADKIDFNRLQRWIGYCKHNHGSSCDPVLSDSMPALTLMDCMCFPPRLVTWQSHHRYAALSYVWGVAGTTGAYKIGDTLDESTIPYTIRDAMAVARKLGLYLWVDRYCIPQDPKLKQDQIARMDVIYGGSDITIVAAAGPSIEYGLPGVSQRSRTQQPFVRVGNDVFLSTFGDAGSAMQDSEWWQRAWCFQEALLSRRRLIFTQNQIYFQCRKMACVEVLSHPYEQPTLMPQAATEFDSKPFYNSLQVLDMHEIEPATIEDIIEKYSRKHMSYESDALNAAAGILRALSRTGGKTRFTSYGGLSMFGHPSTTAFVYALFWHAWPQGRREGGQFPTWSWTGWVGQFRSPDWSSDYINKIDKDIQLRLIDEDSTTVKWDDFVNSGRIRESVFPLSKFIQLYAVTSWVTVVWKAWRSFQYGGAYLVPQQRYPSGGIRYAQVHMNYPVHDKGRVSPPELHDDVTGRPMKFALLVPHDEAARTSGSGILLRPVGDYYERIGSFPLQFIGGVMDTDGNQEFFEMDSNKKSVIEGFDFKREWICIG